MKSFVVLGILYAIFCADVSYGMDEDPFRVPANQGRLTVPVLVPDVDLGGRRKFSTDENAALIALVQRYGRNWSRVAAEMGNRTPRQCQSRYTNYLNPERYHPWTPAEDGFLRKKYGELGPKWSQIAAIMGKIEIEVKNRVVKIGIIDHGHGRFSSQEDHNLYLVCNEIKEGGYTGTFSEQDLRKLQDAAPGRSEKSIIRHIQKLGLMEEPSQDALFIIVDMSLSKSGVYSEIVYGEGNYTSQRIPIRKGE
ncbi:MAG: SANT/Myb domain-containing protein [Holosporales bacterium]|jgi:hypothetical protein|nr:SANT/Myb domain-containing protein [Holosporales bacterium]